MKTIEHTTKTGCNRRNSESRIVKLCLNVMPSRDGGRRTVNPLSLRGLGEGISFAVTSSFTYRHRAFRRYQMMTQAEGFVRFGLFMQNIKKKTYLSMKKSSRKLQLTALMTIVLTMLVPLKAVAQTTFTSGDFTYQVLTSADKTVGVKSYSGAGGDVAIPETVTDGTNTYIVTEIMDKLFYKNNSITGISLPTTITSIGEASFAECKNITGTITINNKINRIGLSAFNGCSNKDLKLSFTNLDNAGIGESAFRNCCGLRYLKGTIKFIYRDAFYQCLGFEQFDILNFTPPTLETTSLATCNDNLKIGVFEEALATYQSTEGWKDLRYTSIIPSTVFTAVQTDDGNGLYFNLTDIYTAEVTSNPSGSYSGDVSIPNNITYNDHNYKVLKIGDSAFANSSINSLTVYKNVESIGENAFSGCASLVSVGSLLDKISEIPNGAFCGCSSLTGNYSFHRFSKIGDRAFSGCNNNALILFFYDLSDATIGEEAFSGCIGLKYMNGSIASIGSKAFFNCGGFETMYLFTTETPSLGADAFTGCSSLTVNVPKIALAKFQAATGWKDITLATINPKLITCWSPSDGNGLNYDIYDDFTAKVAMNTSFSGVVTIPDYVTYNGKKHYVVGIAGGAFAGSSITSVTFGSYISEINSSAFDSCNSLTGEITLSSAITNIGSYAFFNCGNSGLSLSITNLSNADIGSYAFMNCTGLKSIGGTASSIAEYAFFGSTNLTTIGDLLKNTTVIPDGAFENCKSLTGEITLSSAITSIGSNAFSTCGNSGLSLSITNLSNADIGSFAFYQCTGLKSIGGTASSIGYYAFSECANLTTIGDLLKNITVIPDGTFVNCTSLTGEITLSSAITSIGSEAFSYCGNSGLSLSITNLSNAVIGSYAFENCTGLKSIGGTASSIAEYAFFGSTNLTTIGDLLKNITNVPIYAFKNCTNLSGEITLNAAITNIGKEAFVGCKLTTVSCLAAMPPTLGYYVFGYYPPTFKVPYNSLNNYQSAWASSDMTIIAGDPTSVTTAANSGSDTHWATFSNTYSDSELKVSAGKTLTLYNATVADGQLTLAERTGTQVAKGEAVLVKTDAETVTVTPLATTDLVKAKENDLLATPEYAKIITPCEGYKYYRLTYNNVKDKTGLGFYLGVATVGEVKHTDGTYLNASPYKAYLKVSDTAATEPSSSAPVRGFAFPDDDETTGIGEIVVEGDAGISGSVNADGSIYNLQGQQVSAPTKGLYIKNNKKVIIK